MISRLHQQQRNGKQGHYLLFPPFYWHAVIGLLLLLSTSNSGSAFQLAHKKGWNHHLPQRLQNSPSDEYMSSDMIIMECSVADENQKLKQELYQYGASYNRGYGALGSTRIQDEVLRIIGRLEESFSAEQRNNQTSVNVARNMEGKVTSTDEAPLLRGPYRMIWTTAADVLILEASPFFTTGAIYQVFEPPVITNIIDFVPKLTPNSLLRAQVTTRASSSSGRPNRVGLVFERVELQPRQIFGQKIDIFPPLLGFDLPRLPSMQFLGSDSKGGSSSSSSSPPGFFDITYWDGELLVIRQNAPGGLFVLTRTASAEP